MLDTVDASSIAAITATLPIPRVAQPGEVTKLVLFVASEDAGYMTGTELVIDGGLVLGQAPQEELGEVSAP
jgi:3alpha(or 20beta)-hydroxysteroid dehydrogenase